ncbi:hypothetical protein [Roseomonas sp. KE0001]|uniref:hypothetical protein n=1 Tax=unclassified Roseomonas TaxID=2617492 RepID=UPI0018DFBF39|nr:hypothetical protein [Roseomonas sp. KE0001]MBI0435619.1 hypothetical protein [Roseomonas sp. KE0001]
MSQPTRIAAGSSGRVRPLGLALLLGLGGCAQILTGEQVVVPSDSLTAQRILGVDVAMDPLLPVAGNVWPEGEPERTTLATPDTPFRPDAADSATVPRAAPPRRGSSTPPALLEPGTTVGRRMVDQQAPMTLMAPPPPPAAAPVPRYDGQVIQTPNGPAVTSGGGPAYRTYNLPGGGSGIATQQGGTTTLLGADGSITQVPTPR